MLQDKTHEIIVNKFQPYKREEEFDEKKLESI